MKQANSPSQSLSRSKPRRGFSLVELMMAMAVFLVVGAAAVGVVRRHAPLFASQQNQAGLNIAMRNVVAQMQIDVVNGGSGYYPGANTPDWPIGITIAIAGPAKCVDPAATDYVGCTDALSVIEADSTMPVAKPSLNSDGTGIADTKAQDLYLTFAVPPPAAKLTEWAASFKVGDQILLKQGTSSQPKLSTVVLDQPADVNGSSIHIHHRSSSVTTPVLCPPALAADTLGIYDKAECAKFQDTFDPATDYVLRLSAITYYIDNTTEPTNPKLIRRVGLTGNRDVIAEQIIGFKVSAWSSTWSPNTNTYSLDPADYSSDWTTVKAVRIVLTGRTPPNSDATTTFRNSVDGGPYQVQAVSVVINPRNLSM
jgi:prepilin-type N-terminal cleavage/methylation domain-containing protein